MSKDNVRCNLQDLRVETPLVHMCMLKFRRELTPYLCYAASCVREEPRTVVENH